MSKHLNIMQAMKMPIGTEFKIKYSNEMVDCHNIKLEYLNGSKLFKWSSDNIAIINENITNATFIPIQQPVSFMEVVNSGKKCRVEHELFTREGYWYLREILAHISDYFNSEIIRKIILEGKWYIEESEEE